MYVVFTFKASGEKVLAALSSGFEDLASNFVTARKQNSDKVY